jgi:two-component system response regulator YesN
MPDRKNIQNLLRECVDLITTRISEASVKILSEKFNIHPNLFCYYFRKVTGKPFKKFVLEKRLELAKFMLLNTEKSVTGIAKEVGYSNLSNFNRFFRKFTGMSPKEYRKNQFKKDKKGVL